MAPTSPWWTPGRHADRRPFLLARRRIKTALRTWLEAQGFAEVDPGCLAISPGNETHLHAFRTERIGTDLACTALYLHTSPEIAMKKLLAAGEAKIFALTPVFRNREHGALHASEFTMLEWYRAGEPYETVMQDAIAFLRLAASSTGTKLLSYRDRIADPFAEPERLTVAEAVQRHAGIDLLSTIRVAHQPPLTPSLSPGGEGDAVYERDKLAEAARAQGLTIAADDTWSDIFSKILAALVEPRLGIGRPVLLSEYPACEAALAQRKPGDPRVALRFELYCSGVELANGFSELTDAAEQRVRFEASMAEKERIYGERYPIDEDFLDALSLMPAASGCALGFDRLVMLASGASHIDQVLWTPLA